MELRFGEDELGFELHFAGRLLLAHTRARPALSMARGASAVTMLRGNFRIEDAPSGRLEPTEWRAEHSAVVLLDQGEPAARLELGAGELSVTLLRPGYDRIWLRLHAAPGEAVWGGGEIGRAHV